MSSFYLLVQFLFAALVATYANPGSCSGSCVVHDPALIRRASDGKYFRFSTGGGIAIATASSPSGTWTDTGTVRASGAAWKVQVSGNAGTDAWAPDVHLDGSTYYLYYSISSFGSQVSSIGVATSTTLEAGSWTDRGAVGVASSAGSSYNAIDANFISVGGTYYLNFGSFWNDIYQVEMSTSLAKRSSATSHQISYTSVGSRAREGSFMFYNSGYYYLLWSEGICCGYDATRPAAGAEYKIMMCRSTSGTGGFVDQNGISCTSGGGSVLLPSHDKVYGPGGQGVYNNVLYYHYVDTSIGYADGQKRFGYNTLSWSNGWPSV